jgi:hypothetical protein
MDVISPPIGTPAKKNGRGYAFTDDDVTAILERYGKSPHRPFKDERSGVYMAQVEAIRVRDDISKTAIDRGAHIGLASYRSYLNGSTPTWKSAIKVGLFLGMDVESALAGGCVPPERPDPEPEEEATSRPGMVIVRAAERVRAAEDELYDAKRALLEIVADL